MSQPTKVSHAFLIYGLIGLCVAVIALFDDTLSFAVAYSILFWMGYGAAVVFGQLKVPRPKHLHQVLYCAMWWPWYRKRYGKGQGGKGES